jgi:hypothetical protein
MEIIFKEILKGLFLLEDLTDQNLSNDPLTVDEKIGWNSINPIFSG